MTSEFRALNNFRVRQIHLVRVGMDLKKGFYPIFDLGGIDI
jgi:hypothetical protein